jgi:hypothetical protein
MLGFVIGSKFIPQPAFCKTLVMGSAFCGVKNKLLGGVIKPN